MQVFVDESGDTGLNQDPSTSVFFVVTAVIFRNQESAIECSQQLDALKKEFGLKASYEFKFSKLKPKKRIRLLQVIASSDFTYSTVILDKKKLRGEGFKYQKSCYKYPIQLLFKNAKRFLSNATICFDQFRNEEFSEELQKYLNRVINAKSKKPAIKDISMKESHTDNLLQLTDVVCGVIARSLKTDKSDHREYRPLIIEKEAGFQKWPKRTRRVIKKKKPAKSKKRKQH